MVYVGAAWPLTAVAASYTPWFKRGRIREIRWFFAWMAFAVWLVVAIVLHIYCLRDFDPPPEAVFYPNYGGRAGPGLTFIESWLVLGTPVSVLVAFRSIVKPWSWQVSRWRRPWWWR